MVPVVMFYTKMAIGGNHQGNLCQPLFPGGLFVAKFMGGIDTQAAIGAGGDSKDQHGPVAQVLADGKPGNCNQGDKVQGYCDPGKPAVVTVFLQLRDNLFRRIVDIGTKNPVQHRDYDIAD